MSITTPPQDTPTITAAAPDAKADGPLGRIAFGSMLTGVVGAAVLTLVCFAGGTEGVITGSALLAFAASWALFAGLTTRYTSQSQRWAYVPATVMGVTGLGLVTLTPGTAAMTNAGWVWPPVMFALAAWMGARVRRSLKGRTRWLVYPAVAAMSVASVGGLVETLATHQGAAASAAGTTYAVRGRTLHMECKGTGGPTVVLESGLGETSSDWARIVGSIAVGTRVCAYDRAGQGGSDDATSRQDGLAIAADLHDLLATSGEHAPFVLVGHSTGGTYVMTYAARYPAEVAGMVLLDSSTPDQFTALPSYPAEYSMMRRGLGVAPVLARLGIGRVISTPDLARRMRNMRDEVSELHQSFEEARALKSLAGKPLAVLTTSESLRGIPGWAAAQDRLALLSTNSSHRTVDTTHSGIVTSPAGADEAARAIAAVVTAVRTSSAVIAR